MYLDCRQLPPAELEKAIERFLAGCGKAREELIEHHIALALRIASRYNDDDISLEALHCLVVSVDKFKEKRRDNNLTAFLSVQIHYDCLRAVSQNKLIRVSKSTQYKKKETVETEMLFEDDRRLKTVIARPPCSLEVQELLEKSCDTEEDHLIIVGCLYEHTLNELSFMLNRSIGYISQRRQVLYKRFRFLWEK